MLLMYSYAGLQNYGVFNSSLQLWILGVFSDFLDEIYPYRLRPLTEALPQEQQEQQ